MMYRWCRFCAPVLLLVLSACSDGVGPESPIKRLSDAEYLQANPEQRTAYLNEVGRLAELDSKKEAEYQVGLPVYYGDSGTGFTAQWIKRQGVVAIYPGHNPFGIEGASTEGAYVALADAEGNILTNDIQGQIQPVTPLLANVANESDWRRGLIDRGFDVLTAGANGVGAALVDQRVKDVNRCKDCGGPANVIFNDGSAAALSSSAVNAAIVSGGSPFKAR